MAESTGRILVVDDNPVNRMMLSRAVERQGHQVSTAVDGLQALELLRSPQAGSFDVILLDILMPGIDGYQVLEQVKSDSRLRHIPVIMISALDEIDSVVRCIEQGAADYLPKPFNPALLRARLNASLAAKRLRDLELEYLQQVGCVVEAAEAVEAGHFDPSNLDAVAARTDALGKLARVFLRMAQEVRLREQRLRQQLEQLRLDVEEMRRALAEPLTVYVPVDRQQAMLSGSSLPDRTVGAALFADISGFTPLTAALAQELGLQRGAEELTRAINQVYTRLVEQVHRYGGSVIGFAGDAITCWFDALSPSPLPPRETFPASGKSRAAGEGRGLGGGVRAAACALAMQEAMMSSNTVTTPAGARFPLAIKVAVVAGPVRRFLVGDPQIQLVEAVAGETLDRLAAAEHAARRGEVIVDGALADANPGTLGVRKWLCDDRGRPLAVLSGLAQDLPPSPWPDLPPNALGDAMCRPWVLPVVYDRVRSGNRQFLSDLRPVTALFLNFRGIDYDADEAAGCKLDAYVRWVQHVAARHEGIFDHLTMGDKGSYICLAFGASVAHGDDEARAVYAALELTAPPPELAFVGAVRIGIAAGQALVGSYGGAERRTYGVQGDRVNLAARLMVAAAEGDILCDEVVFRAAEPILAGRQAVSGTEVTFAPLPPIHVKGRSEAVAIYRPIGRLAGASGAAYRESEARHRIDCLSPSEQLTLKVASILGPVFDSALLADIFPVDSQQARLSEHLEALERQGLLARRAVPGSTGSARHAAGAASSAIYTFVDASIHQSAYDSMLFMQRRHLHRRAAEWYEQACAADLSPHYAVLAHHWRRGDETAKAVEYLEKAGQLALARGALSEAQQFFQESLDLDRAAAVLSAAYYGVDTPQPGPDYQGALRYALGRLEKELPAGLVYHNLFHTRDDVLPTVRRLAELAGVGAEETRLLETAAAYHDIGFIVTYDGHEQAGAKIAAQSLPGFGFTAGQVARIQGMILATRMPQSPHTPLEELLADADLDVLGREDALPRSLALQAELAAHDRPVADAEWYLQQVSFLRSHRYFTSVARGLRDEGKLRAIAELDELIRRQPDLNNANR